MAMDFCPLKSSFLSGSMCDDSRSLFEQWKEHLEFQYDFVKVMEGFRRGCSWKGIIQENDRYRDEMDRLEKELKRFRYLHASDWRDYTGRPTELFWEDDKCLEGKKGLSQKESKVRNVRLTPK
jgi:hypothetical protein